MPILYWCPHQVLKAAGACALWRCRILNFEYQIIVNCCFLQTSVVEKIETNIQNLTCPN